MSFWKRKAEIRSSGQTTVKVFAPAKVNLTLHVVGRRADGYHLLDSLVAFAQIGDTLTIRGAPAPSLTLAVEGPERQGLPEDAQNLIMQVARMLASDRGAALSLDKMLPIAAGLGGGSADAAAALRGLLQFWQVGQLTEADLRPHIANLLRMGADIPMCLASAPARVGGIGEKIEPVEGLPDMPALLVNPRVPVSTAEVFKALTQRQNRPMPEHLPNFARIGDLAAWLATQRNDLQSTAIALQPAIAEVLASLEASDRILLARMSGSGATCFGLFPDKASAVAAGEMIRRNRPGWWVAAGMLGDQGARAMPVVS